MAYYSSSSNGRSGYSGYSAIGTSGYSGVSISGYSGYSAIGQSGYSGYSAIGVSGYSGYSGPYGGNSQIYKWDTSNTDSDPGDGEVRVNNLLTAFTTFIYIDLLNAAGTDITLWLHSLDDSTNNNNKGQLVIYSQASPNTKWWLFNITGDITDATTYIKIPVSVAASSDIGYLLSNGENVVVSFSRTGNSGTSGFSGYSGRSAYSGYSGRSAYSGYSGAGASGYSGYSSSSGYSGYSAYSGISGYSGYSGHSAYSGYSGVGTSGYSGYSGVIPNPLLLADGTEGNPSLAFTSDTGTGLYYDVDDEFLGINVDGSRTIKLDSTGVYIENAGYLFAEGELESAVNLKAGTQFLSAHGPTTDYGITSDPGLSLGDDGNERGYIRLYGTTSSRPSVIQSTTENLHLDTSAAGGSIYLQWYAQRDLVLCGQGGNVGIGTSSPGAKLDCRGSAVFNEDGADADFRIESDGNTHAFFLDAGADSTRGLIGIRVSSPASLLDIDSSANSTLYALNLKGGDNGSGSRLWKCTNASGTVIYDFRGSGLLVHNLNANDATYTLQRQGASRFFVDGTSIVFNEDSADVDFRVETDGQTHAIYADGGLNKLSFLGSTIDTNQAITFNGTLKVPGGSASTTGLGIAFESGTNAAGMYENNPGTFVSGVTFYGGGAQQAVIANGGIASNGFRRMSINTTFDVQADNGNNTTGMRIMYTASKANSSGTHTLLGIGEVGSLSATLAASGGTNVCVGITPTYNQSSTASGTDLLINRTETAIGSGTHNLIDAQVGGASKFSVSRTGDVTIGGTLKGVTETIIFGIDGGGAEITTGTKFYRMVDFACTVTGWTILSDQTGDIVVDVKRSTYSGFPTTSSIAGSEKPTLSSARKNQDNSLSTWTTSLSAGDVLEFIVDSVADVEKVTVMLKVVRA